ncbi:flagellar motor protein MotB [Betaproteobacteria bacterium GR16-43]|nr:flagellar motor protein MotB [Betaproteobacteria bacterium GR16-43]
MKLEKTSKQLGLAVLAAIAAGSAAAHTPGWYGGFSIGQSAATIDDDRILRALTESRFSTASISDDDRDTGYKLFFGRQLNNYLAVEAGAFDLGKFGFSATTLPVGTLNGSMKVRGLNLDLVGNFHLTEKLSAFGRIGAAYAETKDSFSGSGAVRVLNSNPSKKDTNYKAGVGLEWAFTPALSMRGEFERYRINDAVGNKGDIDLASVGLVYRFGAYPPAPVQRVAYTEPAAPAPVVVAPAPVAPAPAPTPPRQPVRVTFAADALFDFDKAILKPAGKQALDKFASDLRSANTGTITITGHTDRIGSPAYNQKLSARRAEAVRAYLVQSAGIPAGKITSSGAGETNPVTKRGECRGETATKSLVACLQPDRRVDVEVSGTK